MNMFKAVETGAQNSSSMGWRRCWLFSAIVVLLAGTSGRTLCRADETLVLQGQNPRLTFDDNSGTPQMWDLYGDHTGLDVIDSTAGTAPFHLDPGALDNSLVILSNGKVGFGTSNPLMSLHVATSGLFPTLRLETTGAAPRVWDLSAHAQGFDLLDVNNSNAIPFSVQAGAPTNSLYVASNGRVGLGTSVPTALFHAQKSAEAGVAETLVRFNIADDPIGRLDIVNASSTDGTFIPRILGRGGSQVAALITDGLITTDAGTNPVIAYNAAKISGGGISTRPLVVYRNNNVAKVTVAANGNITATAFIAASSRTLKDKIVDLDSQTAQEALRQLSPVEYVYKDDATADRRIGFIAEDVPEIVAEPERKSVPVMDIVALVTKVVKDQQQTIEELKKSNTEQTRLNLELMNRISQLERQRRTQEHTSGNLPTDKPQ